MEQRTEKNNEKSVESVLKLEHLVCDELRFIRKGFKGSEETKFDFSYGVHKDADGEYRARLIVEANRENEFQAMVQMTGYFSIDENDPQKDELLKKNAVAIILPYLRSQMTLLTSQPETEPAIFPIVNVNNIAD